METTLLQQPDDAEAPRAGDVVRSLYEALSTGDVPGVLARLDPDVLVDEPPALPYGGAHRGRDVFMESALGAMMGYADAAITEFAVFAGEAGVVGTLTGTLTAHSNGETFPLTMVELHEVAGQTTRRIDVYVKDPDALAAFYARAAVQRHAAGCDGIAAMTAGQSLPARSAPSGRGQARENAILDAVAELIAEVGYDQITVDVIAARARTSKATMYRRWPDKAHIVADVLRRHAEAEAPDVRDTGTLRGDLLAAVDAITHSVTGEDGLSFLGLLEGIRGDAALRDLVRTQIERRAEGSGAVITARASARGDKAAVGRAAPLLGLAVAQLLATALLTGAAPSLAVRRSLVDDVLLPLLTAPERQQAGKPAARETPRARAPREQPSATPTGRP